MDILRLTRLNEVFKVERYGDSIIVRPQGDAAGFAISGVHSEMNVLCSYAESKKSPKIILDLTSCGYLGSIIIGELLRLSQAVRKSEGRIAMACVSPEMRDVLKVMKIETLWEQIPTLAEAKKTIAVIPFSEQAWRARKAIAAVVAVALLAVVPFVLPASRVDDRHYAVLAELVSKAATLKQAASTQEEWDRLIRKAESVCAPISASLEKVFGTNRPNSRNILYVSRDYLIPALKVRMAPEDSNTADVWHTMQYAEKLLLDPPKISISELAPPDMKLPAPTVASVMAPASK